MPISEEVINEVVSGDPQIAGADEALKAIEFAMREIANMGATTADIDARWSKHSNDVALREAVKASLLARTT